VKDQPEAKIGPIFGRHHPADPSLDLDRILDVDQAQPVAEPGHVSVDREARLSEGNPEDHVGGLATDTGQTGEALHGVRNLAVEVLADGLAHADQGARLGPEEAGRVDERLQFGWIRPRIIRCELVSGEERRRHLVHLLVSGLGGEDGRHQQLQWALVI